MRRTIWVTSGLLVVSLALGGCAGARGRRQHLGLLEQRVTALEQRQADLEDRTVGDVSYLKGRVEGVAPRTEQYVVTSFAGEEGTTGRHGRLSMREIQLALKRAGYDPGPIDGKMGSQTKAAIKAFQRSQGLEPDGVVGRKTWARLNGTRAEK